MREHDGACGSMREHKGGKGGDGSQRSGTCEAHSQPRERSDLPDALADASMSSVTLSRPLGCARPI